MHRYIIQRILFLIPILLAVSFLVYALLDLAPGTIIDSLQLEQVSPEKLEELTKRYNFDKPMIVRYGIYMGRLLQGDLGVSDFSETDVWGIYIQRLPNTLKLAGASILVGTVLGLPLGIYASLRAGTLRDSSVTFFSLVGLSMPSYWMGLLLLLLFSLHLEWLPTGGFDDGIKSLIIPAFCSGVNLMAGVTRQTRSSMLEVLRADYLRTARAKGVPEQRVIWKHALGNAWIPILTTLGGAMAVAVSGSAVTEMVFSFPGIGRMLVEAINARDVTTTMGCVVLTTTIYVLMQLVVDLMYAFVDPRIKSIYTNTNRKSKRRLDA